MPARSVAAGNVVGVFIVAHALARPGGRSSTLDRFAETSAAGGDKPGAAGEAHLPPAPAVRSPSPCLERLARPVEIAANAGLRPGAEAHRAQLGGVRVHVVER